MIEHDGRGLNLTNEVRDAILNHTGPSPAGHVRGRASCGWWTASPTSTTTSTTRFGPACWSERALPDGPVSLLGALGLGADRRPGARPGREARRWPARCEQSPRVRGRAARAARVHVRARVPGSDRAARDGARGGGRWRRCSSTTSESGEELPGRAGRRRHPRHRLGCGHDRRLLHARVRRAARASMTRIRHESVEAVKEAVDMIDLVSGRTQMKRSGAEWRGRCPFHEERTAFVLGRPGEEGLPLLRLRRGRRCDRIRHRDGGARLLGRGGVAGGPVRRRAASTSRARPGGRSPPCASVTGCSSCWTRRRCSTSVSVGRGRGRAARSLPGRARHQPRERRPVSGSGFAPAAPDRVRRAALSKGFTAAELEQAGLTARGGDRFRDRLMFPLCDARGRVRGFGARQMPGGRPPKYLNTSDGPVFRKSDILYGLDLARRRSPGRICHRGRGVHRRDHAPPGGHRSRRGVDGHGADGRAQVSELRRLCPTVGTSRSTPTPRDRRHR